MKEKKLTDEEIVKAWECHIRDGVTCGKDCPYREKDISCLGGRHARDTLDLIHRLQSENEELKARQKCHFELLTEKNQKIVEQMSEIERLKETSVWKENEQLKKDLQRKELLRQKAVIYAEEKQVKNTELQKQVDELTAGMNRFRDEHDKMASYAQSLEEKNVDLHLDKQELMNEISECKNDYARLDEAYVNLNKLYQQAVKDTAKEILQMLYDDRNGYWDSCDCGKDETYWRNNSIQGTLNEIKERYGVEVE